ncbi:MAG: hypothetical protein EXS30_04650 [Pedosphaera sp.]|nr:hypothetical protein [Pedosphaera sp.]
MVDWNIQSRAHACQACQKPFAGKELFWTLLFDQNHAYERLDVCEGCWGTQYSQGATDRKGFISFWQSVYAVPPSAPPDPIKKETAESLLRKLIEQDDPSHAGARFILAVMLERKRLLKVKAQLSQDNQRVFIYEHVKSGDLFNIVDPNLQLDQLEEVQRDVSQLLEVGLNPPENAQPTAALENRALSGPSAAPANAEDPNQIAEPAVASPSSMEAM